MKEGNVLGFSRASSIISVFFVALIIIIRAFLYLKSYFHTLRCINSFPEAILNMIKKLNSNKLPQKINFWEEKGK